MIFFKDDVRTKSFFFLEGKKKIERQEFWEIIFKVH